MRILLSAVAAALLLNLASAPYYLSVLAMFGLIPLFFRFGDGARKRFFGGWLAWFFVAIILQTSVLVPFTFEIIGPDSSILWLKMRIYWHRREAWGHHRHHHIIHAHPIIHHMLLLVFVRITIIWHLMKICTIIIEPVSRN